MAETTSREQYIGARHHSVSAVGYELSYWFVDRYGAEIKAHGHVEGHFMFAASGAYISDADAPPEWGAPPLVCNPPGTWHRDHFNSPGSFFSVTFSPDRWAAFEALGMPTAPKHVNTAGARVLIAELMRWAANARDGDHELTLEALCLELAGAAAGSCGGETARPRWLGRGCDFMREHHDRDLSLSEIANASGVHPYHFARTFRRFEGRTPGGFLQALRLDHAASLLTATRMPLAEVALASGFADQCHFTRHFSAAHGVSPRLFRQRLASLEMLV